MSKKNKTLDTIRAEVQKLQGEGFEPLGMSYTDKEGNLYPDSAMPESGVFEVTSKTDLTLESVRNGKNPVDYAQELFEFKPNPSEKEDSPLFRQTVIPVKYANVGTPNLGYIPWGPSNNLPNFIFDTGYSNPYIARSLQFMRDQITGLGVEFVYRWSRYSNGTVVTSEIPYSEAGPLIRGRIAELEAQLGIAPNEIEDADLVQVVDFNRQPVTPKPGSPRYELNKLYADYETWERVNEEVQDFCRNNNLYKHQLACMTDFVAMDMYYPLIGLSRGEPGKEWQPKIVSIRQIPCVAARLEEMDEKRVSRHVYYSDRWRAKNGYLGLLPKLNEIVAYPALPETNLMGELRSVVNKKKRVGVRSRPTWFCVPRRMPAMNALYYTRPTWWSVYTSQIYEYASTLIADRAAARRNSTMWGKIIMINHEYLASLWAANGCTDEQSKMAFRRKLKENIDNFLKNRNNNGATVMFESVVSPNGNEMWDSVRIIDVPFADKQVTQANKTELSEISNVIFLAMGMHSLLMGNEIAASATGGTAQRELDLLKQKQLAPMQKDYLDFLTFVRDWNDWDPTHGAWRSRQMSLTTLDASKTGTAVVDGSGEKI
jgi:hypothetical protein